MKLRRAALACEDRVKRAPVWVVLPCAHCHMDCLGGEFSLAKVCARDKNNAQYANGNDLLAPFPDLCVRVRVGVRAPPIHHFCARY